MRRTWLWPAMLAVALTVAACGTGATPSQPAAQPSPTQSAPDDGPAVTEDDSPHTTDPFDGPVVEIAMTEMAFTPPSFEIVAGKPTLLRFTNEGRVTHEAMVGDAHMQEEFAGSGGHAPGADHHGDVMAVTVAAGDTADIEVVVDETGTWYLGCHLPGHYEGGMKATMTVAAG